MTTRRANVRPVILSGGAGTRLWPLSRREWPKQFLPLGSSDTMLQETARRVAPGCADCVAFAQPMFVCNQAHAQIVAEQLGAIGVEPADIVLEPEGRNTAPAVTLAALLLSQRQDDPILLVLPSDHVINDVAAFHAAVEVAAMAAEDGRLVAFGIPPRGPKTGFGYVRRGTPIAGVPGASEVARFVEKPDRETAEEFLAGGDYSWNSGMFVLPAAAYLAEVGRHAPAVLDACRRAVDGGRRQGGFFHPDRRAFARAPAISIDHAVMEHTTRAAVVAADIGWSDIGSWSALWEEGTHDEDGNVVVGDIARSATANSYLRSDGPLIATVGLDGFAVVASSDAVLVAPMSDTQRVRAVVEGLIAAGRPEALRHAKRARAWGSEEKLAGGGVRRLTLRPGARLGPRVRDSAVTHWVVTGGRPLVTNGGDVYEVAAGEAVTIAAGTRHAIEAPAGEAVELIEVEVPPVEDE